MKKSTFLIILFTQLILVNYFIFVKVYGCHPFAMSPYENMWTFFTGLSFVVACVAILFGIGILLEKHYLK